MNSIPLKLSTMKKIVTLLFFLSIALQFNAQTVRSAPCPNLKNWDWTNQASYNFAYVNGRGKIAISSPFHTTSSADQTLTDIIRGKDYIPTEGWVLLRQVFGCPQQNIDTNYPHFMLYNKYRGIIRVFIFNGSPVQYEKAAITVSWDYGTNKTSIFAPSEVIQYPNIDYHNGTKTSNDIVNYVQNYYSAAWFVTDIPVTFDHLLDYSKDFFLRINVYSSVNSSVKLDSKFTMNTKTVTANATPSRTGMYEFAKETQDMLSKVPSQDQFKKYFDGYNNIMGTSKGEKDLQATANAMSKNIGQGSFQQIMSNTAGLASFINSSIGAGLGLINFFMGKSNKNAVSTVQLMPLISNGEGSITGTITTKTNATSYPLQLPATNHYFPTTPKTLNYDGLPIYDCPLGVLSLEESPTLGGRMYSIITENSSGFNWDSGDFYYFFEDTYYRELSLASAIKLAHNASSNTQILDVKAQLLAKVTIPYGVSNKYSREMCSRIESGEYVLLDKNDKSYTYGTKVVDVEKLKNQKLIIPYEKKVESEGREYVFHYKTPVYLKLLITMKPTDLNAGQTPILYIATYNISGTGTKGLGANGKTLVVNRYFENCNSYNKTNLTNRTMSQQINYMLTGQVLKIQNSELKNGSYKLYRSKNVLANIELLEEGALKGLDEVYLNRLSTLESTDIYILKLSADGKESVSYKFKYR